MTSHLRVAEMSIYELSISTLIMIIIVNHFKERSIGHWSQETIMIIKWYALQQYLWACALISKCLIVRNKESYNPGNSRQNM